MINRKHGWLRSVVLTLIIGSWIGNIWYYESSQLEEPLFLQHHISIIGDRNGYLDFTYLENNNGDIQVEMVRIEELPQLHFQFSEKSRYVHQVLKIAYADWNVEELQLEPNQPLTITEVTVFYNNGQSKKIPIGEVHVLWSSPHEMISFARGSSSSDGTGTYTVRADQSFTLEDIDYTNRDKMPSFELNFTRSSLHDTDLVHDTDWEHDTDFPIDISKQDLLDFQHTMHDAQNNPYRYDVIRSYIELRMRNEALQEVVDYLPMYPNLSLDERDIRELVRTGGAYE